MISTNENVVFLTLDCCSYKTTEKAEIPFIRKLGEIYSADSYATYTLPSHISAFAGYFPKRRSYDPKNDYFCRNGHQLWRLKTSRVKEKSMVDIFLDGETIIDGYRKMGFYTLGTGGVRWFRSKLLTNYFQDFLYFGNEDYQDVFEKRVHGNFALDNVNCIINKIANKEKWFLFMNCHETHVPYDSGENIHSDATWHLIRKAKPLWGGKINNNQERILDSKEFEELESLQIAALESIDKKLSVLFARLPKPFVYVIMGDHGENFGENGLYGHGFSTERVINVPLMFGRVECDL